MQVRQLLGWTALTAAVISLAVAAVLVVLHRTPAALGTASGCAIGLASLMALGQQIRGLPNASRCRWPVFRIILAGFLKYAALGAAIWAFLREPGASGAGLAVGVTIVYLCFGACALRQMGAPGAIEEA